MTRKKLGIGLLETFSEACDMCAGRGVIVHHEPHMRSGNRSSDQGTKEQTGGNSSGGRGKKNRNQPPKQEVAKVVTAESASQINNLVAQIAASTLGDRDVAGSMEDKSLDSVMDALPEPTAPNQGRKKAKRVTSGGIVTPESDTPSTKGK
jgi:ribonuclease E